MTTSAPVVRGCGSRVRGALYLETHTSPWGTPVDDFLLDPPMPVDTVALGISAIGQKLIADPQGVYHVVDWIGAVNYPNVSDYIEETKRHGISRRVSTRLDLSKLTRASRLLLIHPRAIIRNVEDYWRAIDQREGALSRVRCLAYERGGDDHRAPQDRPMCAGLWAFDVEGGIVPDEPTWGQVRTIGDTTYGCPRRVEVQRSEYQPGYFGVFPIGNFAVISDPDQPAKVEATYEKVRSSAAAFDVRLEDA